MGDLKHKEGNMTYRESFITDCEDMANEYAVLAKKHTSDKWGQAFYTGVSNTLIHIANALGGSRSPRLAAKEKLLGAIFTDVTPNFLNVNQAIEQFYGNLDNKIAFDASQDKQVLQGFFNYCKKNNITPSEDTVEQYIQWVYYDDSEEEEV